MKKSRAEVLIVRVDVSLGPTSGPLVVDEMIQKVLTNRPEAALEELCVATGFSAALVMGSIEVMLANGSLRWSSGKFVQRPGRWDDSADWGILGADREYLVAVEVHGTQVSLVRDLALGGCLIGDLKLADSSSDLDESLLYAFLMARIKEEINDVRFETIGAFDLSDPWVQQSDKLRLAPSWSRIAANRIYAPLHERRIAVAPVSPRNLHLNIVNVISVDEETRGRNRKDVTWRPTLVSAGESEPWTLAPQSSEIPRHSLLVSLALSREVGRVLLEYPDGRHWLVIGSRLYTYFAGVAMSLGSPSIPKPTSKVEPPGAVTLLVVPPRYPLSEVSESGYEVVAANGVSKFGPNVLKVETSAEASSTDVSMTSG